MRKDKDEMSWFQWLRSTFLPIKKSDFLLTKIAKTSAFYLFGIMVLITTVLLFAAFVIAA